MIYVVGALTAVTGVTVTLIVLLGSSLSGAWLALVFGMLFVLFGFLTWLMAHHFDRLFRNFTTETESLKAQVEKAVSERQAIDFTLAAVRRLNEEIASLGNQDTTTEILSFIKQACDGIRDAYVNLLGIEVRVCVKQVGSEGVEPPFVTDAYRTNEVIDRSFPQPHLIDENTDFRQLYRGEKKVWFTGSRSTYPDYNTTSVNPKYESVIVWPVTPRPRMPTKGKGSARIPIRAFLCLDSEEVNAFDEKRDVAVGWLVADALSRVYELGHS
ncbi:hypothetical protein [Nesterenkonia muleiensis]|uniref:hypothetical protein n=1 Tax=Nesterenkonia muleiensis TaxID=2282648 RepID=UPI00130017D7|nr:hypothetical protein [Nesterenkonia muleiensis]